MAFVDAKNVILLFLIIKFHREFRLLEQNLHDFGGRNGGPVEGAECLREISSIKICIAFIVSLDLMSALKAMTL